MMSTTWPCIDRFMVALVGVCYARMIVIMSTLCDPSWLIEYSPNDAFNWRPKRLQNSSQTMPHIAPKSTPCCPPECSPDDSLDDLQNTPESASQMMPLSQVIAQAFWPECGPNPRPTLETHSRKHWKKIVATMWPELCPESGPSFWLGLAKYIKIPYLGLTLSLGARATFWPTIWPQSGQILIQLFEISISLFSNTTPNPGRILPMNRGPPPWLGGGVWVRIPRGPFWRAVGRVLGEVIRCAWGTGSIIFREWFGARFESHSTISK